MGNGCCNHIKNILQIERDVIKDHIAKHKWCNKFKDENEAIVDFIHKYAWIMRELFCGVICPYKDNCDVNEKFKKAFVEDISDGEIEEYIKSNYKDDDINVIKIKLQIIKHNIKDHKWLNHIDNYESAVRNFLETFGWIIYDMYKRSRKNQRGEQ